MNGRVKRCVDIGDGMEVGGAVGYGMKSGVVTSSSCDRATWNGLHLVSHPHSSLSILHAGGLQSLAPTMQKLECALNLFFAPRTSSFSLPVVVCSSIDLRDRQYVNGQSQRFIQR